MKGPNDCPYRRRDVEPPDSTRASLIQGLRGGESLAWSHLVARYAPQIYRWIKGQGIGDEDACELGQEVFQAIREGLPDFRWGDSRQSFRGWICTIAHNKTVDFYRKHKNEAGQVAINDNDAWQVDDDPDDAPFPVDPDREDRDQYVRDACEVVRLRCQERTWKAFALTTMDGLTTTEAAAELQMTANAVCVARSRVLAWFREELTGKVRDEFDQTQWMAYELVILKKRTEATAAEATGLPLEAVQTAVSRVSSRLREILPRGVPV